LPHERDCHKGGADLHIFRERDHYAEQGKDKHLRANGHDIAACHVNKAFDK
jgi:hypothetical protein